MNSNSRCTAVPYSKLDANTETLSMPPESLGQKDDALIEALEILRGRKGHIERDMKRRMEEWKRELEEVQQAIDALEVLVQGPKRDVAKARKKSDNFRKGTISSVLRDFAISQLSTSDRPLGRQEILERMFSAGITIDKPDPAKFLSRVLWRTEELINEGDGYWLASRQKPS